MIALTVSIDDVDSVNSNKRWHQQCQQCNKRQHTKSSLPKGDFLLSILIHLLHLSPTSGTEPGMTGFGPQSPLAFENAHLFNRRSDNSNIRWCLKYLTYWPILYSLQSPPSGSLSRMTGPLLASLEEGKNICFDFAFSTYLKYILELLHDIITTKEAFVT